MDDALRMYDDIDIFVISAEEVMSFDDLQSLVHHRGAVHRDLCTHIPVWVRKRISHCHLKATGGQIHSDSASMILFGETENLHRKNEMQSLSAFVSVPLPR